MAAFTYRAMDRGGRSETGVLEAASAAAARQDLRARGLFPVQVSATRDAPQAAHRGWALRSPVSARDLTVLTRQIATLIGSGVRIDEALQIAAGQANPRVASVLLEIRAAVRDGQSLERALSAHPKVFSDYYRASVQAGEQSGQLEEVMGHLATFVDNRARNGQTIQLALLYPALLAFVSVGIITLLMAYVLPDIVRVFTSRGADLPWLTRALILISDALRDWGLMGIAGLAVAVVSARQWLRRPANRFALHKWLATSRMTARIVTRINAAQFSGTLATLVQSRVPLVEALTAAAAATPNRFIRAKVDAAAGAVREGASLRQAIGAAGCFPQMLTAMIASGEVGGRLGDALRRAADDQQRDLDAWVRTVVALVEPAILLVMGGLVMLMVLAILLPIVSMNSLVGI